MEKQLIRMPTVYDYQYWTPANNLIWLEELLNIIRRKLNCCQDNNGVYCCSPTRKKISIKLIQIPSKPIKPCEDFEHHQVGTWTLNCTRCNQTTEKLIASSFDILDSVRIDHLPNIFCLLIVLIQCKIISRQIFVLFW